MIKLATKKTKETRKTNTTRSTKKENTFEGIKVTCPNCKTTYQVEIFNPKPVQCMDCGHIYLQKTHSNLVADWIREKILTVTGF